MAPKVSVIVPFYNAEEYLRECVDSILRQTLEDVEILLCNNGSRDGSLEIAEEYTEKDDRVMIRTHGNFGQGGNLNDAVKIAHGTYICEVDSDDFIAPEHIELLYTDAITHGADVVKCNYRDFRTFNGLTVSHPRRNSPPEKYCGRNLNVYAMSVMDRPFILCRAPSVFCGLYRRKFILDNELFWRPDKNFEDTSLAFKIAAYAGCFRWMEQATYYHRMDNPNSGTSTIFDLEGIAEQLDEIDRVNVERGLGCEKWIAVQRFNTYVWMLDRLQTAAEKADMIKICTRDFKRGPDVEPELFNRRSDYELWNFMRGLGYDTEGT